MIIFDPSTESTRFDYFTMQSEWTDFLTSDCNVMDIRSELDLLTALVAEHAALFTGRLNIEGIRWDDLNGRFACSQQLLVLEVTDGDFPLTREELDLIWADCFDMVNMHFEVIEAMVLEARERGMS